MAKKNIVAFYAIVTVASMCAAISCKRDMGKSNVIEMDNMQVETLYMSDYFESIEYIPLETTDECLIGNNAFVYILDEIIVTIDSKNCFVFDRSTGKWIGKIGHEGRGPGEYSQLLRGPIVNEQDKTIYFGQNDLLVEYSLTDMSASPLSFQFRPLYADHLAYIQKDLWAVGLLNTTGDNPHQILFYDRTGVVDSIPNHYKFTLKDPRVINVYPREIMFYRYDHEVYYKQQYNDTIFRIADKELHPAWIFKTTKSPQALYELKGDLAALAENRGNYYLINSILETNEYLFLSAMYEKVRHSYLYDKVQRQVTELKENKFINDIDGGVPFWPVYTDRRQELVCVFDAYALKEEADDPAPDVRNVKNISDSEKFRTLVSQLNENDNPVVMIVRPKTK